MTPVLDTRATAQVGRHARLELVFARRGGRTVLAHSYAEPPFRTGRWFVEGGGLHMILASSAPGIFAGDLLDQTIIVEEGANVRLTSQSAPQLHASAASHVSSDGRGAAAVVRSSYRVAARGRLSCHWDPLIPFPGARLDQRIEINLDEGSHLYWSDAMMSGRDARGERWLFTELAHELRICRGGELAYLERFGIAPAHRPVSHPWIANDAAFFGTTIVAGGEPIATSEAEEIHRMLAGIEGVTGSADTTEQSLLVVRLMSARGVPFHVARDLTRTRLRILNAEF